MRGVRVSGEKKELGFSQASSAGLALTKGWRSPPTPTTPSALPTSNANRSDGPPQPPHFFLRIRQKRVRRAVPHIVAAVPNYVAM